jgi:hypothetical protein
MLNCYPREGGGLTFCPQGTETIVGAGMNGFANPLGYCSLGGIFVNRSDLSIGMSLREPDQAGLFVVSASSSTRFTAWRWADFADDTAPVRLFDYGSPGGAGAGFRHPSQFATYLNPGSTIHVVWNLTTSDVTSEGDVGIWSQSINVSDQTNADRAVQRAQGGGFTSVAVHQNRILAAGAFQINYSDVGRDITTAPGTPLFPTANFLRIQGDRTPNDIVFMQPVSTSDLLVGTAYSGLVLIQGDFADPSVRVNQEFTPNLTLGSQSCWTPYGAAFTARDGIYLTADGSNIQRISEGLYWDQWFSIPEESSAAADPKLLGTCGIAFHEDMLYVGTTNGTVWVYDFRTQSWFTIGSNGNATNSGSFWPMAIKRTTERELTGNNQWAAGVLCLPFSGATAVTHFRPRPIGALGNWAGTRGTWTSLPIRHSTGRRTEMREVRLHLSGGSGTTDFTVTVGGQDRTLTYTGGTTVSDTLRFYFTAQGEFLDIQVVALGTGGGRCPDIEAIDFGLRPIHTLT